MKTVTIDQNIYNGAASFAHENNISVESIIEQGIMLFINRAQRSATHHPEVSDEEALEFVSSLSAKGGRPVPADEDGRDSRIEKYLQ